MNFNSALGLGDKQDQPIGFLSMLLKIFRQVLGITCAWLTHSSARSGLHHSTRLKNSWALLGHFGAKLAFLVGNRYLSPLMTTSLPLSVELLFSSALAADVILPSFMLGKVSWVSSEPSLKPSM